MPDDDKGISDDEKAVLIIIKNMQHRALWLKDRANLAASTEGERTALLAASFVFEALGLTIEASARELGCKI